MNTQNGVGTQNGDYKRGSVHVFTGSPDSGGEQMPVKLDAEPRVVSYESGEPYDVYVGRGKRGTSLKKSKWHNPFVVGKDGDCDECIDKFERHLEGPVENYQGKVFDGRHLKEQLPELVGKTLCCHCAPERCHASVLLSLAELTAALAPVEEAFLDDEEEL
jgi:hypothetical protein